jgi:uncharacterized protein YciI
MAWYVVMSKSTASRDAIRGRESENLGWMKEQHESGRVLFSGPTTEGVGIWVLRGSSKDEVSAVLQTHPWVKDGLRDVSQIYEWNVVQALGVGRFETAPPAGGR